MSTLFKTPAVARKLRPLNLILAAFLLSGLVLVSSTAWRPGNPVTESWQWRRANTGLPREAITLAVAAHPDNPDILWAAYYGPGGVLASRDGGQTWVEAAESLADNPVLDLLATRPAGAEAEKAKVWAATRAGLFWRDETGGQSWRPAAQTLPPVSALALAEDAGGRLYVGLDGAGLYAQLDDRAGWERLTRTEPLASAAVLSIAVSPDGRQLYLGTSGQGLFASRDGGRNWTAAFLGDYGANIAAKPGNPAVAVAALRDQVVRTQDGGQSWQTLAIPWREWTVSLLWLPDGTLNAGTARGRFYRSQDSGDSWDGGASDLPPHGVLDLAVVAELSPGSTPRLLAGSWVGLYDSDDGGQSWQKLALSAGSPNVEALLATEQALFLGARTGLYRWSSESQRWSLLPNRPPGGIVSLAADPHDPQQLYAGLVGEGVYRSQDGGQSWQALPTLRKDIPAIAVNPHEPDNLFILAAWERVYESRDGGRQWAARWEGLGEVIEAVSLVVDPWMPLVYVGTEQGLYRRRDEESWQPVAPALADQSVLALLAQPAQHSSENTVLYIGATRGVYRSLDRGDTVEGGGEGWGRGLVGISVTALLAYPAVPQRLYAGTADHGVYASGDGGQTWQAIGPADLTDGVVESMAWGPAGELFVLTTGGVWRGQVQ